jgi:poly(3-hydroxybutyrate) depolymerase
MVAMRKKETNLRRRAIVLVAAALAIGCSSSDSGDDAQGDVTGTGGTDVIAQPMGSGGTPVTTGSTMTGSGGTPASGMQVGSGGASGMGTGGSNAGTGGVGSGGTSAGSGGSMADAGSSTGATDAGNASDHVAIPSPGCSKASARPTDGVETVAQDHYFVFPQSYDGTKPFPVLVGFHGCGGGNRGTGPNDTEWVSYTKGSSFETDYVRMVPVSADSGGCWNYGTDITRVTQAFDDLLAKYCVDTSAVFATGHSSGAQFVVQILAQSHASDAQHFGFKAVAPVAASDYGAIMGPIPVMYIQGMMDQERGGGDGHEVVNQFRTANACDMSSMPYPAVTGCKSQGGGTNVNPGCVSYDGCDVPTIWCSHDDPFYSGTMHGIPCFAVTAMHDFFSGLP